MGGVTIEITLDCYNYVPSHDVLKSVNFRPAEDSPDELCYMKVKRDKVSVWNGKSSDGVESYGISVVVTSGQLGFLPNWDNLFVNVASSYAFIGLPGQIVVFVTVSLLGHLSKIYTSVIYER